MSDSGDLPGANWASYSRREFKKKVNTEEMVQGSLAAILLHYNSVTKSDGDAASI